LAIPYDAAKPIRVAAMDVWVPKRARRGKRVKPVNLGQVEKRIQYYLRNFPIRQAVFDQHQAVRIMESLSFIWAHKIRGIGFSTQTLQHIAATLYDVFADEAIKFNPRTGRTYDQKTKTYHLLQEDLAGLSSDTKTEPPKLGYSRSGSFHNDMSIALGLALIGSEGIMRYGGEERNLSKQVRFGSKVMGGQQRSAAYTLSETHVW
jgi:hypothetical protein